MRQIRKLLKYNFSIYLKTSKIVVPFVIWTVFLYFQYSIFPVDIVSSTITSSIIACYIMIWIGVTYYDIESPVAEQIIMLKVKNKINYFAVKIIFIFLISLSISFLGILVPFIQSILYGFRIYTREATLFDIGISYLLHVLAAFTGGMIGGLLHPRIIKNRKLASLLALIISLMAIVKGGLNESFHFLKYVTWIFPPLDNFATLYTNKLYFEGKDIIYTLTFFLIYIFVTGILQIYLINKNKF
jgi:hypothetical protein